jgi:FlaA1/EpsC-like NDP-sugar epimerase
MKRWYERFRSRMAAMLHDLCMAPAAWIMAYWVRFNLEPIPFPFLDAALLALPVITVICALSYWHFGLYRGVWRFASLPDLIHILKAVTVATVASLVVLFIINRMTDVPRSVPPLFFLFQLLLLASPRILYRWIKDRRLVFHDSQRVLIVGAGYTGEMLARDMLRDARRAYLPVAFIDERLRRHGGAIHGIPIWQGIERIPELVTRLMIDVIVLAMPTASAPRMRRVVHWCEQTSKPLRIVPRLHDWMQGMMSLDQLRAVSIEDLLGRDPVDLDWTGLHRDLADRVIVVTGAGGSIGSELCRQLITVGAKRLILLDNSEFNLYRLDLMLAEHDPTFAYTTRLLDVTDRAAVTALLQQERPSIIFHAAAYKHVPMLEGQIRAAVRNNVLGTQIIATAAHDYQCERFVLISTDKAVNPANVMGATKRVAEQVCQALNRCSTTRFITVRFGNVLGSAGSVVPLFQRQIANGGPVTVTDPDVKRFFMTITEACQLIMQAALIGQGGDVLVLDMGEPVKIQFLAEQMIRLSGQQPNRDIFIHYTGLRPGEKRFEELFYHHETPLTTGHPKIRVAQQSSVVTDQLNVHLQALYQACENYQLQQLQQCLQTLVPEWQSLQ